MVSPTLARLAWQVGEPLHARSYFGSATRAATDALGLAGGWQSYFGCRAAPLGAVSAATVTAVFYGFAPRLVKRAVPDVWARATPAQLLDCRLVGAGEELERALGTAVAGAGVRRAAELAGEAAGSAAADGRPLGAANAALPVPDAPHFALWQALATLRELRGDGHVSVLVASGIGPCAAHALAVASGRAESVTLRRVRGWSEEEWAAGADTLRSRGWLARDGALTAAGRDARQAVEDATDRLAAACYAGLGEARTRELVAVLRPLADRVVQTTGMPVPNPIGLPWPPDAG